MNDQAGKEPMLEMFIFETLQLLEQLERAVLQSEQAGGFEASVHEIFRVMHTIKGNAAMLLFNHLAELAHSMEDLFHFIREQNPTKLDTSELIDLVLTGGDFIKGEIAKIDRGETADGTGCEIIESIRVFLAKLKADNPVAAGALEEKPGRGKEPQQIKYYISSHGEAGSGCDSNTYQARIFFDEGCGMEDLRSFALTHQLKEIGTVVYCEPDDNEDDGDSAEFIRRNGLNIRFMSRLPLEEVRSFMMATPFLSCLELDRANHRAAVAAGENASLQQDIRLGKRGLTIELPEIPVPKMAAQTAEADSGEKPPEKENTAHQAKNNMISVNIHKLDTLMDLVGELVIAESMVTQNPDLSGLILENFQKSARQLHKITNELQDVVMSVRMVPLTNTFQKMNRLVRDMGRKLGKQVKLELIGADTEVDKNIIEQLSDPLMHLIRNALDHGLEAPDERLRAGKSETGALTLEAKNVGGEVWISVKDDGRGLNRGQILRKAREKGLFDNLTKEENEMSDREVFAIIMQPGFSTKEAVTEFSGRGVGMDVVAKNLAKIGGKIVIDSVAARGTTVALKIPLTLAIINGMTVKVGNAWYTVPTTDIRESFRPLETDIVTDPAGNEMMMIRGECYPILRLHHLFKVETTVRDLTAGIIVMIENDRKAVCLFADELLGEQQVVVKPLPGYIRKVTGVAGCTILGEGNISLIIDSAGLIN